MVQRCSDARTGPFLVRPPTVQKVQSGFQWVSDLLSWSDLVALLAGISRRNKCATSLTILGLNFHPFGSKNERIRKRYWWLEYAFAGRVSSCHDSGALIVWMLKLCYAPLCLRSRSRSWSHAAQMAWSPRRNQGMSTAYVEPSLRMSEAASVWMSCTSPFNFYQFLSISIFTLIFSLTANSVIVPCLTRGIIESLAFFLDRGKGCANAGTWPGDQA